LQQSADSTDSSKNKKLKKGRDHKASTKLQKTLSNSDSEDEEEVQKPEKKRIPRKSKKQQKEDSSEELVASWRNEFDDGLDDEFIGGASDREKLEGMTEREREEEFYKRAERREELKKRFEISQKLKQNKRKEASSSDGEIHDDKDNSREDSAREETFADPGSMSRKKGYEEKHKSKFSALNQLKAKREEKERKEKLREEKRNKKKPKKLTDSESGSDYEKLGRNKKKGKLKASEIYSSSSSDEDRGVRRKSKSPSSSSSSVSSVSDGESDTERQNNKKTVKRAINIETREELEKIRLSRFKMDKFAHLPIFKKTVIGCFVRIGIGKNPQTGNDVYRCCEILDVCETGKIYNVMKTKTNLGLKIRHGKDTRVFRLQFVSNQPFTEHEFEKWKLACVEGNVNLPTNAHIEQKSKDIQNALTYRLGSMDVQKILDSKKRFDTGPKNYAVRKTQLITERDKALMDGEQEKADELNAKLDDHEYKAEELDRQRTSTISTIALINNRNRKGNVERAYKGIQADELKRKIEGEIDDPFTRRKTKPKLGIGNSKKDDDEPEMTTELLLKLEAERKKKEEAAKLEKKPAYVLPPPVDISIKADNKGGVHKVDIFDAHNFDLDINVDTIQSTPITPSINLKPVTASTTPAGPTKRSIKLDEWKKKRGII